jgi:hypothetical protein
LKLVPNDSMKEEEVSGIIKDIEGKEFDRFESREVKC